MHIGWSSLVAWRSVRRRLGSHTLVAVVVALGFGASFGAAIIADATHRAYSDYVSDAHVNRLVVNPSVATPEIESALREFDGVADMHADDMFFASFAATRPGTREEVFATPGVADESWTQVRGSADGRYSDVDRPVVTRGRLATGTREIFVSEEFRRPLEHIVGHPVDLGDEIDLAFWPGSMDRAEVEPSYVFTPLGVERLRVVGFGYLADEVVPAELFPRERAIVSPDVAGRYSCVFDMTADPLGAIGLGLRDGCSTQYRYFSLDVSSDPSLPARIRADFEASAEQLAGAIPPDLREQGAGYYYIAQDRADVDDAVREMTRPAVAVLVVFAVLAALVTVTVTGFAMVRLARRARPDLTALRAVGATRRQLAVALGAPLAGCCAVGLVGALGVAAALSLIGPIGRVSLLASAARVQLPARTVGPLVAFAVIALAALAASVAWAVTTPRADGGRPTRTVRGARVLSFGGRPAATIGVRSSLGGATRSDAMVLASGIVVVSVTTVCVVFGANLSSLASDGARYGWAWDAAAVIGGGYGDSDPAAIDATLAGDARVDSYSLLAFDSAARIDGHPLPIVVGFPGASGGTLPIISGRMPASPGELLMGSASADEIGLEVGDTVPIELPSAAVELGFTDATVVGIGVLPNLGQLEADVTELGRGAYLLADTAPDAGIAAFVGVDLADGVDPSTFLTSIADRLPTWSNYDELPLVYDRPVRPPDIVNVEEMRNAPLWLGIVLGSALLIGSMLAVSVSVRERRREFAVLRSLGFCRRDLRAVVVWQAITTAVVGLAVGVPIGIVAGRFAWRRFADDIGVVPDAGVPVAWVAALGAGIVVLTLLAAVAPARIASRIAPALALRGV